jgi:hypothetical protein
MTSELSGLPRAVGVAAGSASHSQTAARGLRSFAIAAGIAAALLFVVVGIRYELQMYADGSLFSYAVAVQDAWAFHCHNIAGRLAVYLFAFAPAQAYVGLSGDAAGGVAVYGFLFFVLQFLGLIATFLLDRSASRLIFCYACASTACLCPLVFGFPTEVWMMHALFWPTLAACHFAPRGARGIALIGSLMLAMVFTHAGALIAAGAILATLALRGRHDPRLWRGAAVFGAILVVWTIVKLTLRPDAYTSAVLARAALHVFDPSILSGPLVRLLFAALAGYALLLVLLRRVTVALAHAYAAALVALGLAAYWLHFDGALHAENRYYMRTVLLLATPAFGVFAGAHLLAASGELRLRLPLLPRLLALLSGEAMTRAAIGALALVLLIHVVETEKFLQVWSGYKSAVRTLAMGHASDPALGSPSFVSSDRIPDSLNRTSWFSTTLFLSVLLAPRLDPARLVVHPRSNYFWISCETAAENLAARRAVPVTARELVRAYSCQHRWRRPSGARAQD